MSEFVNLIIYLAVFNKKGRTIKTFNVTLVGSLFIGSRIIVYLIFVLLQCEVSKNIIKYDFCEYVNASMLGAVMEKFPVQVGGNNWLIF